MVSSMTESFAPDDRAVDDLPDAGQIEIMARTVEQHPDYRVLRRLQPRPVDLDGALPWERVAVLVDTETTGLDPEHDEIIELGMLVVTYSDDGKIGRVVGEYSRLREPSVPIPEAITKLTGITPDMVVGKRIDIAEVRHFLAQADIVIAHNSRFDRPFCERLIPRDAATGGLRT
jgi:DNA polymerase-3 subunit epsilon